MKKNFAVIKLLLFLGCLVLMFSFMVFNVDAVEDVEQLYSGNGQAGVNDQSTTFWGEAEDTFRVEQPGWYIDRIVIEHEDTHPNASDWDSMNYIGFYNAQGYFAWYHLFHLENQQLRAQQMPYEMEVRGNHTGVRLQFRPWQEVGDEELDMARQEEGWGFYLSEVVISNGEEEVTVEPDGYDIEPPDPVNELE